MTSSNGNRPDNKPLAKVRFVVSQVVLCVFGIPFAAFGIFAIYDAWENWRGNIHNPVVTVIFGLIFCAMGFGIIFRAITAGHRKKKAEEKFLKQTDGGAKPWLLRADWAAGKIKSSANAQTKVMAIMALAFCGLGGLVSFVALPKELHNGNYKALIVLIFPAIGIGLLIAVVRAMLARRRFGDCFFELAQIPIPLGGTLDGMIQTGVRLRLEHGLHLKLSCIRRVASGSGNNRSVQETVLWQDEKIFKSEADLPEPEPGHSGIPVFFKLPANQPECFARGNEAIIWQLGAKAKMAGPDFSATFDVPVFKVAGAAVAESDEPDPTASLQMPVEEQRRDEHSKIQVTDGPGGREFYFPAARNLGTTLYVTALFFVWTGFTAAFYLWLQSPIFEIIFTLVDVLLFVSCLNLWIKSSRVTINPVGVTAVNHWLFFRRAKNIPAKDAKVFETKIGMTCGTQAFYNIQLALRSSKKITLATGIASKTEADWLVQEMTRALNR